MALQVFTAGQTLTATQMTTLQASTYNYSLSTISGSTYTILSSDAGKLLLFTNNATPVGVTFPASLGMAVGDTVEIVHGGTGTLTLIPDAGVTLNSEGSLLSLTTRYARISVTKTASNVFLVSWMTAITEAEITTGSVTSDKILNGTILDIDINASALIAHSKLATTTAGNILLGTTTTGVITATAVTGDVTITGAGVTAIGTGAVTSAKLGSDLDLNGTTEIDEILETVVVNGTALTGTVQIDAKSGSVHYFTANSAANWIWNLRGDGSTTLNSMMDVGQAITFSLFATIDTTAYKPTSITVDTSATVAVKWFGGNAYPSGNVSSIDCYTITVVKTATSTFTAFASQSKFA